MLEKRGLKKNNKSFKRVYNDENVKIIRFERVRKMPCTVREYLLRFFFRHSSSAMSYRIRMFRSTRPWTVSLPHSCAAVRPRPPYPPSLSRPLGRKLQVITSTNKKKKNRILRRHFDTANFDRTYVFSRTRSVDDIIVVSQVERNEKPKTRVRNKHVDRETLEKSQWAALHCVSIIRNRIIIIERTMAVRCVGFFFIMYCFFFFFIIVVEWAVTDPRVCVWIYSGAFTKAHGYGFRVMGPRRGL